MISNVHSRTICASADGVGALLDSLASKADRLWPNEQWPAMRFDRPLAVGGVGGHGPIRYVVESYEPGRLICFRFTAPSGFHGSHAFIVKAEGHDRTVLRHELIMRVRGAARLSWPFVYRPLHDALIEDSLDKAEMQMTGQVGLPAWWSAYVVVLRWVLRRLGSSR